MKEYPAKILLNSKPATYVIRRSKRVRSISLKVSADDGLVVVIPHRYAIRDAEQALIKHSKWAIKKLDHFEVWDGPRHVPELVSGAKLLLYGNELTVLVRPLPGNRKRSRVFLEAENLVVELGPDADLNPRPLVEKWYRKIAKELLVERVEELGGAIGLLPKKVIVGQRTSRWGSCSSRGTLSFCYRLIMAPPEVIDYVVAHELCHLQHLNHSKRFYTLLDQVYPGHEIYSKWLKENGHGLVI